MAFNGEIFEIFSWLQAKAIYKFSSVCKTCCNFVSEDYFSRKQSQNMSLKDDTDFFVQPDWCERYAKKLEVHSFPGDQYSNLVAVPRNTLEFLSHTGPVLASSNGLLCGRNFRNKEPTLYICNPVTGTWVADIPLPEGLGANKDINIVFQCNDYAYTLMVMDEIGEWSSLGRYKIYTYKKGWEEMGEVVTGARNIQFNMPVCYNGTVNFVSDCGDYLMKGSPFHWPYIVSYDVKTGSSKFVPIPKDARKGLNVNCCKLGIFKWGNNSAGTRDSVCLVKLQKKRFNVWVMSSDCDLVHKGLWTRVLKIRVGAMGLSELKPVVYGFTVMNGMSLLIVTEAKIYCYDLMGEQRGGRAEQVCGHGCRRSGVMFNSYSSTLRSCGNGATKLPI